MRRSCFVYFSPFSKIHNVDPRHSGNIERSAPTNLNGSSTECASNSSADDSSSSNKRSDDDDEDDDRTESPTRPSVNFYRSIADRVLEEFFTLPLSFYSAFPSSLFS